MALILRCDGCESYLQEADAHAAGRIQPLAYCAPCAETAAALDAALDAKRVELSTVFEAFQAEAREKSGLRAVPDA